MGIKDFFEDAIDMWRDDAGMMVLGHLLFLSLGGLAFTIGVGIDYGISSSKVNKLYKECEELREELGENIAPLASLENFDVASFEVLRNNNKNYLKVFGIEKITEKGLTESTYKNLMFDISEYDANLILEKTRKVNNCEINASFMTKNNVSDKIVLASDRPFNEYKDAIRELYNALNYAVARSYGVSVQKVFEASAMNNRVSSSYRLVKPEILPDVDGLYIDTDFINAGIITSGISTVYSDEEQDISFFYIDTIQAVVSETGRVEWKPCKARVTVDGANLPVNDVYAKFIKGEHTSFTELGEDRNLKNGTETLTLG